MATRTTTATASFLDDRLRAAAVLRKPMRKLFPDHWSFLLGEMALYSFLLIVLIGVFLTFFYRPSLAPVIYEGGYMEMRGLLVPEAYDTVMRISLDVRGGMLIRQLHHWAAVAFVITIFLHLMRVFFTGAFRKPRELTWMIGVTLLGLALVEGFLGYSLPADLYSGTGLKIFQGLLLSVPVIGSYLSLFVFGGEFPGDIVFPRIFALHVLLIPGIMLALVPLHALVLTWIQTHTDRDRQIRGVPFFPAFMVKTGAMNLFVFAAIGVLATFIQVNPVWLRGPYTPGQVVPDPPPDWYYSFIDGALRLMPAWDVSLGGYRISMGLFAPVLLLSAFFVALLFYPFLQRDRHGGWDPRRGGRGEHSHHVLYGPRDAPGRTALGFAVITFFVVLWLSSNASPLGKLLAMPYPVLLNALRVGILVLPPAAALLAWSICAGRGTAGTNGR